MSPRQSIMSEALAVAMCAKCAEIDRLRIDALRLRAEQELDRADPLLWAVTNFCVQVEPPAGSDDWIREGRALHDRLSALFDAPVPGSERKDIHG